MATSVVLESADTGTKRTFKASPGQPITIGRESSTKPQPPSDTDARYPSAVMSSKHAEIVVGHDVNQVFLIDTDSRHGTTVNGQKLPARVSQVLSPGDILKFGVRVDKSPGEFYEGVTVLFRGSERVKEPEPEPEPEPEQEQEQVVHDLQRSRSSFSVPGDDEDGDESDSESGFVQSFFDPAISGEDDDEFFHDENSSPSSQAFPGQDTNASDETGDTGHTGDWSSLDDGHDDEDDVDDHDNSSAHDPFPELDADIYQPKPGFRVDMVTGRETYAPPPNHPDDDATEVTNTQPDRRFDVAPNGVPTFTKNDVALAKAKFAANKINAKILGQQEYELGMTKMVLDWYSQEHAANTEELHKLRATVVQLESQLAGKKRKAEDTDSEEHVKRLAVAADSSGVEGPVRRVARTKRLPGVTVGRALGVVALGATAALFCEWGVC